jgi:hypothetical protein
MMLPTTCSEDGLLVKGRLVVFAEKLAHVYVLLANKAKGILGEREARVRAWNFVCKRVTSTDRKLLEDEELQSAIDSLKEHVGTLENEVGVIINRAPSGPGGDATSAVDPDPLQGFLGKRVGRCAALHGMRCNALRAGWLQLQVQAAPCF